MWPMTIDWQQLRFGVEIEFVGGAPEAVSLLPGWVMSLDEHQKDDLGNLSGSELKPGPITWADRDQIHTMLERLKATGGNLRGHSEFSPAGDCRPQEVQANWSCGLHVHVDLSPWGESILLPLMEAGLTWQEAFYDLLQTSAHRRRYCPPVTAAMREALVQAPSQAAVRRRGNPESNRCGINLGAWWDIGTVEFRFANGSVDFDEICRTVEFYLRFVTAVGAGQLSTKYGSGTDGTRQSEQAAAMAETYSGADLARALGAPLEGFPPSTPCPPWRWEQLFLDAHLRPVLEPLVATHYPEGEILAITPTAAGIQVSVEVDDESIATLIALPTPTGWRIPE